VHPTVRDGLSGDDSILEPFVQEVRRLTPFFPVIAGVAREAFASRDYKFQKGDRFVLDLYGTDRDPQV
jgi:fatty-acid peroxygenase